MEDLSLHILDIVENSIRAGADEIKIIMLENDVKLQVVIEDNGSGMSPDEIRRAVDPFYSTKQGKKTGFGLAFFDQAASETDGRLNIQSEKGEGTEIEAQFNIEHPDMKPIGDIVETIRVLINAHPRVKFVCNLKIDGQEINYDSQQQVKLK